MSRARHAHRRPTRARVHVEAPATPSPGPMIWSLRVAIAVIAACVLFSAGWRLTGGSEYMITSPSMCPNMCVGTLVLDRAPGTHFHVGEVISFTPPNDAQVYTHRIVYVFPDGSLETKGDAANIVDPWRVAPSMVRGREVLAIPAAGWFNQSLPFLALALTVILMARRLFPTQHRREWDRLFVSLMVATPIWLLRPLVRGIIIQTTALRPGYSEIVVVNTGVLPAQFRVPGGQSVSFVEPGHRAVISGKVLRGGQLGLEQVASFHWYEWLIVVAVVSSPLWLYLVHLLRPSSQADRQLVLRGRYVHLPPAPAAPDMDRVLAGPRNTPLEPRGRRDIGAPRSR